MSELREPCWSVLSERGCEAGRLTYADAASLVRTLTDEKVHGLCVITDEAARRLSAQTPSANGGKSKSRAKGKARRRAVKSS